jgi:hypothetical protein
MIISDCTIKLIKVSWPLSRDPAKSGFLDVINEKCLFLTQEKSTVDRGGFAQVRLKLHRAETLNIFTRVTENPTVVDF